VTVEYRIDPKRPRAVPRRAQRLSHERRRDGAYAWGVFEDAAEPGTRRRDFLVESWLDSSAPACPRHPMRTACWQDEIERFNRDGAPRSRT